jgi:SET family sugar efflux transporter-like MFS transporter
VRRISLSAIGHIAVLLAAVIPGAMATSVRAVYLVTEAHIDPFIVGTVNYTSTLLGILIVFYARKTVDRVDAVLLTVSAATLSILSTFCVLAAALSPFFLVGALILSALGSISGASIFVYDERYGPRGEDNAGLYRTRLLLSVAWIVGPPLSFVVFWLAGFLAVTVMITVLSGGSAIAMLVISRLRPPNPKLEPPPKPKDEARASVLGFWPIFIVMVATTCANVLHAINMPLYLIETQHALTFWPGFVMATAAGIEVVVITFLPGLTKATSDETVLWGGLALGVVYFALLYVVTDPLLILFCQLLYGAHFAATTVVCLPLLRRTLVGGTGSLAAQFSNASRIGGLLGSALFAVTASWLGYRGILLELCPALLLFALAFGAARWLVMRRSRLSASA